YPGVAALRDVSFEIGAGDVHALLGANGAGKSTLVKILSGAVARDGGEIVFGGAALDVASPHAAAERGIACLYQEPALVPTLTVEQNIFLGREIRHGWGVINWPAQRRRAVELLAQVAPRLHPAQLVSDLRTSERQLVALAKALVSDARLVIMDEPSASMTDAEIDFLFKAIGDLKAGGKSIVYITHRLDEVMRIADRLTVLRDGRHIVTTATASLSRSQLVEMIAGGAIESLDRTQRPPPGKPLLSARELSRKGVFEGVSLEVRAGEIVGLAGLVGAGRSEIARAIFGADALDGGSVVYPGGARRVTTPAQAVQAGVAMIPEDRKTQSVVPAMTVSENILLSSAPHYAPRMGVIRRAAASEIVARNFRRFGIKPAGSERRRIDTLSGGNQQKAVLARAIESGAEVLVLDEPTAGVDVGAKAEIHRHIEALAAAGKGVLLISSETEELLTLADRILVIREGRLIREIEGHSTNSLEVIQSVLGEHDREAPHAAE
ncbi:MAG: sugar ABC transporter ATP-binding protein, partial [Rhizobiaceae bacterium]|nr:sugar ABC transporter ATP-binding protein [Rhizobiaceae bacterium]